MRDFLLLFCLLPFCLGSPTGPEADLSSEAALEQIPESLLPAGIRNSKGPLEDYDVNGLGALKRSDLVPAEEVLDLGREVGLDTQPQDGDEKSFNFISAN